MTDPLSRQRLLEILTQARSLRIGVIGDLTLDGYWYADMKRSQISRETPLFPRPIVREVYSCGGAANVVWNLCAIGVKPVIAFSIFGQDWRAQILGELLQNLGVDTSSILTSPDWSTPFYGKVILTSGHLSQEDSRVDFVNPQPLPQPAEAALLTELDRRLPGLDALVIADYQANGVMTPRIIAHLNEIASAKHSLFIADSRERIGAYHKMILKPNEIEARGLLFNSTSEQQVNSEGLISAIQTYQETQGHPLFMTLGAEGCLVFHEGSTLPVPAVPISGAIDPVGAGDTFLSALAVALAAGASPLEAASLGCLAAGVSVQKVGVTGTANPDEILSIYDRINRS
ncbi:MAG TPA: PfkB family carbohydrate kinase [Anaerolineaceae bacterium]